MIDDGARITLGDGKADPLLGQGEGRGKLYEDPTESLDALIEALNERFGAELTDADKIMFEQQLEHLRADDDNRVVALENDFTQFQTFIKGKLDDGMVARHDANEALVQKYFDDSKFQDLVFAWIARELYDGFTAKTAD